MREYLWTGVQEGQAVLLAGGVLLVLSGKAVLDNQFRFKSAVFLFTFLVDVSSRVVLMPHEEPGVEETFPTF